MGRRASGDVHFRCCLLCYGRLKEGRAALGIKERKVENILIQAVATTSLNVARAPDFIKKLKSKIAAS